MQIGGYDTVKVVTGWGLPNGWNAETRTRLLTMVPNVIVRTVSGDPSYARPINPLNEPNKVGAGADYWEYDFPDPNRVVQEIADWYAFKPDQAPASKGELREAMELHQKFFPTKQWYVTEFGINDSKQVQRTDKGERYARLLFADESWPILPSNVAGAVYYHLGMKGDIHPEYHIYPEGDHSYRNTADSVGAVLGGAAVLGGGMGETFEPSLMDSQAMRIAELIAELATFESGITANRVAALRNGLFVEPEVDLHQASALRAVLEKALACAQGYQEAAPGLAEV